MKVANMAYLVIYLAVFSSFSSKNVNCSSMMRSFGFLFLANKVFSPTQQTMAFPCPVMTLESERRKGSGWSVWLS